LYRGTGCKLCNGSGYFGRTLVYELLAVDNELSLMIEAENSIKEIETMARKKGFRNIFDITVEKIKLGITSVEEAIRVIGDMG
jgi:type II secretory ATPase GspE/PulE/Tfp pilus assembly ATPase PilB-like protein